MQIVRSGKFQMFDYGKRGNRKKYGLISVPEYPLDRLKDFNVPKYLFRGEFDYLSDQKDYIKLLNYLPKQNTISEVIFLI